MKYTYYITKKDNIYYAWDKVYGFTVDAPTEEEVHKKAEEMIEFIERRNRASNGTLQPA